MPTISVIVPVYKVEAYLDRCVQSILDQTHTDYELILVDDGSPDNCGAMCDAWAEKDSRIRVIHKENGGLSDARNVGIDLAGGEYLSFVDSDDYIHPQMLEVLLRYLRQQDADMICCDCMRTEQNQEEYPDNVTPLRIYTTSGNEIIQNFTDKYWDFQVVTAWNKLYKRELFHQLRYPAGYNCEDTIIAFPLLAQVNKAVFIDSVLYYYYQSPTSIMRGNHTAAIHGMLATTHQLEFLRSWPGERTRNKLTERLCRDYIWNYGNLFLTKKDDKQYVAMFRRLNRTMGQYTRELRKCPYLCRMQKLTAFAIIREWKIAEKLFYRYFS